MRGRFPVLYDAWCSAVEQAHEDTYQGAEVLQPPDTITSLEGRRRRSFPRLVALYSRSVNVGQVHNWCRLSRMWGM
jgi:hypothetical protein